VHSSALPASQPASRSNNSNNGPVAALAAAVAQGSEQRAAPRKDLRVAESICRINGCGTSYAGVHSPIFSHEYNNFFTDRSAQRSAARGTDVSLVKHARGARAQYCDVASAPGRPAGRPAPMRLSSCVYARHSTTVVDPSISVYSEVYRCVGVVHSSLIADKNI